MTAAATKARGRWVHHWEPDQPEFWAATGRRLANRNLGWSVLAEHIGFSVWTVLSVVQISLAAKYSYTTNQLLWLVGITNMVGALARLPYAFAPAKFGGRNFTIFSALVLLVPVSLLSVALQGSATPFWVFVVIAALLGLGGGNFASSMANISHFYPVGRQGLPLGLNAAGGNIGVASGQLLIPLLVIPVFGLAGAGLVWIPLTLFAAGGAWFFMNNLATARSAFDRRDMARVSRDPHSWVLSVLYIGTFGSFIGYSFTFPILIKNQFPDIKVVHYAFLGALVGSLSRPVGGWLADRFGGARVTLVNFLAMGLGVAGVAVFVREASFPAFLAAFLFVFITAGLGNGSTYKMIPAIYKAKALREVADDGAALQRARRDTAAVIGITSATGAAGGFLVSQGLRISLAESGGIGPALLAFGFFYGICVLATWWCYVRRSVLVEGGPSLVHAAV